MKIECSDSNTFAEDGAMSGDQLEVKEEDDGADENDARHHHDESVALDETIVVKRPSAPVFKMPGTATAAGRKRPATRLGLFLLVAPCSL